MTKKTKRTSKSKRIVPVRLTRLQARSLSERYYKYINDVDTLSKKKNLDPQQASDLKKFKAALVKNTYYFSKF